MGKYVHACMCVCVYGGRVGVRGYIHVHVNIPIAAVM